MKLLFVFLLLLIATARATVFSEFYCIGQMGTNVNSGHTTNAGPTYFFNTGNFTNTSATVGDFFTAAGQDLSSVTNGAWASVYTNSATNATFIGKVLAVSDANDFISVSLTNKSGAVPADNVGNMAIRVGGAWNGPMGAGGFPLNFAGAYLTNNPAHSFRGNLQAQTYFVTATITCSSNGPLCWQGYTSIPGDGGRATFVDDTTASGYTMLTASGANNSFVGLEFTNAFTAGSVDMIAGTGAELFFERVVTHDSRLSGFDFTSGNALLVECEAYRCNKANTAGRGGVSFRSGTGGTLDRCVLHDNTGANNAGLVTFASLTVVDCIFYNNQEGAVISTVGLFAGTGLNVYSNASDGLDLTGTSLTGILLRNSNFLKNGGYGINSSGSTSLRNGAIVNCGFGSGTETNASGSIVVGLVLDESGSLIYGSGLTPWVDPANGNFTITAASPAAFVGRGNFTQNTVNSPTNTVSYPSIGASFPTNAPGAGGAAVTTGHGYAP